ncbi:Fur-regulated basic protein FbpA [Bacillus sp. KH172YL63]|uniref:Fur-regulated basic protein FbpA n=1 Tax=Bacillus sp. KH172YL63 TaxID=2709784 RepID=UPI0013E43EC5|nr:Fur-regulated basic protein FbpA [Bacillus sp. KH172YL63]BCB03653.1 hypothetical protein KH172YL63_17860 [Bacillus sp. KH172YL63]
MGKILQEAIQNRRNELINKLIIHNVFKKEDKQLFELTLQELEIEYRSLRRRGHPHNDTGSIQWKRVKISS